MYLDQFFGHFYWKTTKKRLVYTFTSENNSLVVGSLSICCGFCSVSVFTGRSPYFHRYGSFEDCEGESNQCRAGESRGAVRTWVQYLLRLSLLYLQWLLKRTCVCCFISMTALMITVEVQKKHKKGTKKMFGFYINRNVAKLGIPSLAVSLSFFLVSFASWKCILLFHLWFYFCLSNLTFFI